MKSGIAIVILMCEYIAPNLQMLFHVLLIIVAEMAERYEGG
jgi:hypothetical protein